MSPSNPFQSWGPSDARRLKNNGAITTKKALGIVSILMGAFWGFFIGLVMMIGLTDLHSEGAAEAMVFLVILFTFFVFLIIIGIRTHLRINRLDRYVLLITTLNAVTLDQLAVQTSRSVSFVHKDLQKMIRKRYFAYPTAIDLNTNQLIIRVPETHAAGAPDASERAAPEMFQMFRCPGCGATGSKQKGIPSTCEYCGIVIP